MNLNYKVTSQKLSEASNYLLWTLHLAKSLSSKYSTALNKCACMIIYFRKNSNLHGLIWSYTIIIDLIEFLQNLGKGAISCKEKHQKLPYRFLFDPTCLFFFENCLFPNCTFIRYRRVATFKSEIIDSRYLLTIFCISHSASISLTISVFYSF